MGKLGIHILRFTEEQVMKDMDNVLRAIEDYILRFEEKNEKTHP